MAKTNSNFSLSKSARRVMGSIFSKEERGIYKRAMIDAEHTYTVMRHRKPRDNNSNNAPREVPGE